MAKRRLKVIFLIVMLFGFLGGSCKKKDNPVEPEDNPSSGSGAIQSGEVIDVKSQDIGPAGGTIVVSQPGNELSGMQIVVPQNSYQETRTYSISYSKIEKHSLGDNFNPISPLIMIKNGGGYSDDLISVKIPIKKSTDEFAMAFYYDNNTGKLEGLPILAEDDSSVTFGTRHFSTSTISLGKRLGKTHDASAYSNVVITSFKDSYLTGQSIINTGFQPGVDDWEFTNYGSYAASGGHCAGQSISAMWYYYEKKLKGAPQLFHAYDTILKSDGTKDTVWYDNKYGYRLASTLQKNLQWNGKLYKILEKVETTPNFHFLSWRAFAATMLLTGEPQFVGLTSDKGGHAIIAYKISLTENKLFVADPNYPGQEKVITFNGTSFNNYKTRQNANSPESNYFGIGYYSKTSMIDWDKLNDLWAQFENKTIGNALFPAYKYYYKLDKDWIELQDTLTTTTDSLRIKWDLANSGIIEIDETGARFQNPNYFPLQTGKHKYGFAMFAKLPGDTTYQWVDFRWVTIERKAPPYSSVVISLMAVDYMKDFVMLSNGSNITSIGFTNKDPKGNINQSLVWKDNKFSVNYEYTYSVTSGLSVYYSGSINGEIDPEAKTIKQINATVIANTDNGTSVTTQSVSLKDVPAMILEDQINDETTAGDVQKYVESFNLTINGYFGTDPYLWTLTSVDWSNAKLDIFFKK